MGLYLKVTYWMSEKEHALRDRGRDMKLGLSKCLGPSLVAQMVKRLPAMRETPV